MGAASSDQTTLLSSTQAAPPIGLSSVRFSRRHVHMRFTQGSDQVDKLNPTAGTTALRAGLGAAIRVMYTNSVE